MKVTHLSILSACIIICSCSGEVDRKDKTLSEPESKVLICMKRQLPEYFTHFEQMKSDLIADSLIDDTKNSYADLFETIFDIEYTHSEIDSEKNEQYHFFDGLGPMLQIFNCAQIAHSDSLLSDNQYQYFELYVTAGKAGAFDNHKASQIIRAMSEQEFESNGVLESTVFYLGHEYLFKRYCTYEIVNTP